MFRKAYIKSAIYPGKHYDAVINVKLDVSLLKWKTNEAERDEDVFSMSASQKMTMVKS